MADKTYIYLVLYTILGAGLAAAAMLLPMILIIRLIFLLIFITVLTGCVLMWILLFRLASRKKQYILSNGGRMLILAAHQDDCAAIAGGYAVQTIQKGGEVNIIYLTNGDADTRTRPQEAVKAWDVFNGKKVKMEFLHHNNTSSFTTYPEIEHAIEEISQRIQRLRPDTIFIPLYEGGNYQHDVLNYVTWKALESLDYSPRVYESPEYNFYFSFIRTPEKFLAGIMRLFPGMHYDYAPEPINSKQVLHLKMTEEELVLKEKIILGFKTQNPDQLLARWRFEDRYQVFSGHDYTRPPFDYEHSAAAFVDRLKGKPLIGRLTARLMIWTRTIHPDPNIRITTIPFIKKGR